MRRGQTESSFQWLFVLIAGGILFLLFGVLIRSCTQAGPSSAEGLALSSVEQKISSAAWQGESQIEIFLPEAEVVCPSQGSLTFIGPTQQASVDDVPVFISPGIGGEATLKSSPLLLQQSDVPIVLGTAVYVIDHTTAYLFVQDRENRVAELVAAVPSPRTKIIDASRLQYLAAEIPDGSSRVVVIALQDGLLGNADLTGVDEEIDVFGIVLLPTSASGGSIRFFSHQANAFRESARGQYPNAVLGVGAIISGNSEMYSCGEHVVAKRTRLLTELYASRANALGESSLDAVCIGYLNDAKTIFSQALEQDEDAAFLAALFSSAQRLTALQGALRAASCPVIA